MHKMNVISSQLQEELSQLGQEEETIIATIESKIDEIDTSLTKNQFVSYSEKQDIFTQLNPIQHTCYTLIVRLNRIRRAKSLVDTDSVIVNLDQLHQRISAEITTISYTLDQLLVATLDLSIGDTQKSIGSILAELKEKSQYLEDITDAYQELRGNEANSEIKNPLSG